MADNLVIVGSSAKGPGLSFLSTWGFLGLVFFKDGGWFLRTSVPQVKKEALPGKANT